MNYSSFVPGPLIYENSFNGKEEVSDWILEGSAKIGEFENKLLLQNELDPNTHGDNAHWVLWCPILFPDRIMVEWDFYPIEEPGLCMLFFAANGKEGIDLFDQSLPERSGKYPQYHSGSINTYHVSYFRRKHKDERAFHTCNLRKSYGFHLVAQGADPIPSVVDTTSPYRIKLIKYEDIVQFSINELPLFEWKDNGESYDPILSGGYIGFRQMAPMRALYSNFSVRQVQRGR